ncbi:MAG: 16S rRNA (uracil(1498)-N(3))-methyltransferase [Proteobacteria bacterium]|nr:16S rRNA (uracil(1498)-N(3))-methyltransferase [Pseudomonadota bacterium]
MRCRLYVEPGSLAAGIRVLSGEDYHFLFRVRRLRVGDALVLFDGAGNEAEATVTDVAARRATLAVSEPRQRPPGASCRLTVAQALIKGERMDWCIQKLTELGAAEIIPLQTARTVVDLDQNRAEKRHRRYVSIAANAARQSSRKWLPDVNKIININELWTLIRNETELKLALWEGERERTLVSALPNTSPSRVVLLVGPEGGFEEAEMVQARAAGFVTVGLGPHILRAETAALAAAALIGFAFGDLG